MFGSGMNLITTVIAFAMSATFIVFVCTRIICGRIRRAQSGQMFQIESRIDLDHPPQQIRGLESDVVADIPTLRFNSEAFNSIEDAQCSICLGEYQEKEVLRIMPRCGHNFHLSCIDTWLRKQSTCPVCRLPLQGSSSQSKHSRPATFRMTQTQSMNSSETSTNQSRQWLLRGPESSIGNQINNQAHPDASSRNLEMNTGQAET